MNKLYSLSTIEDSGNAIRVTVILEKNHEIFKGHFPGNPILPGVCIIQMIKELLIESFNEHMQLCEAKNIKYLYFINPYVHDTLQFEIQYKYTGEDRINCTAKIFSESTTFCSFKGVFLKQ